MGLHVIVQNREARLQQNMKKNLLDLSLDATIKVDKTIQKVVRFNKKIGQMGNTDVTYQIRHIHATLQIFPDCEESLSFYLKVQQYLNITRVGPHSISIM